MQNLRTYISNKLNRLNAVTGAAFTMGMLMTSSARADTTANSFNTIADNITKGITSLPGFLTGVCYLMGLGLSVLGIMKIKDHVENPSQAHLKDGAIRLAVGGALFTLPIVAESMQALIGQGNAISGAALKKLNTATNLSSAP
ncbi:MAG: hypothetical protein JNK24_07065 [Alphaproteobacteria bacterium]|nr:hypothetical protein [Alphaproteobacteria bacterium]